MRFFVMLVAVVAACGGASGNPPKQVAIAASTTASAPPAPDAPQLPPANAVFRIDLGKPNVLIQHLSDTFPPLARYLTPNVVSALASGKVDLASVIDMDAPAELAAWTFPDNGFEMAVRLRLQHDFEPYIRRAFHDVIVDHGVLRFGGDHACEVRGNEAVCATNANALRRWRALPHATSSTADFHGVMDVLDPSAFAIKDDGDRELFDVGAAMEHLTLDVTTSSARVDAHASITYGRTKSSSVQALLGSSGAAPSPDVLARLPADAELVVFASGVRSSDLTVLRGFSRAFFVDEWNKEGRDPATVEAELDALGELLFTGGPVVVASGFDHDALDRAMAAQRAKPSDANRRAAHTALDGYWVIELEEEPRHWADGLRKLVETSTKSARTATKKDDEAMSGSIAAVPVGVPATLHVELSHKNGTSNYVTHLFVVPDGHRTWLLDVADVSLAKTKAREILAPSPPNARAELLNACSAAHTTICGTFTPLAGVTLSTSNKPETVDKGLDDYDRARLLPRDRVSFGATRADTAKVDVSLAGSWRALRSLSAVMR